MSGSQGFVDGLSPAAGNHEGPRRSALIFLLRGVVSEQDGWDKGRGSYEIHEKRLLASRAQRTDGIAEHPAPLLVRCVMLRNGWSISAVGALLLGCAACLGACLDDGSNDRAGNFSAMNQTGKTQPAGDVRGVKPTEQAAARGSNGVDQDASADSNGLGGGRGGDSSSAGELSCDREPTKVALVSPTDGLTEWNRGQLAERAAQILARQAEGQVAPAAMANQFWQVFDAITLFVDGVGRAGTFSLAGLGQELGDALDLRVDVWREQAGQLVPTHLGRATPSGRRADILFNGANHFEALMDVVRGEDGETPATWRRLAIVGNGDCLLLAFAAAGLFPSYQAVLAAGRDSPAADRGLVALREDLSRAGVLGAGNTNGVSLARAEALLGTSLRQTLLAYWQRELAGANGLQMAERLLELSAQEAFVAWTDATDSGHRYSARDFERLRRWACMLRPHAHHRDWALQLEQQLVELAAASMAEHDAEPGDGIKP